MLENPIHVMIANSNVVIADRRTPSSSSSLLLLLLLIQVCFPAAASGTSDTEALLSFKATLVKATALSTWDSSAASSPSEPVPCEGSRSTWKGVLCREGVVFGLRLENMSLTGPVDMTPLADLRGLFTISLMWNNFSGPMPRGLGLLGSLRSLYLGYNAFEGRVPKGVFGKMTDLRRLRLEWNRFHGEIPDELTELPKLVELSLEGNGFEGEIPEFRQDGLQTVNLASNRLEGRIPDTLSRMNSSFFEGNKDLCGKPLGPCEHSKPPRQPLAIAFTVITVFAVLVLLALIILLCCRRRPRLPRGEPRTPVQPKHVQRDSSTKVCQKLPYDSVHKHLPPQSPTLSQVRKSGGDNRKLHFVRGEREKFSLQELLGASAEVLGSGGFGSSYKAVLSGGHAVVVKRIMHMSAVGKEDFYDHMKKIGRLSHPNLLPLIAFYYKREEKLLVSDFVPSGSLAALLHAKRAPGQPVLDWPGRLKIVKGVARGLAYLYRVFPDQPIPHGHLKSSNILLGHSLEPLLTDYALMPMVNKDQCQPLMVAYKSPEPTPTRKTDVWSLGILILELLTGKFPANYLRQGKGANTDLAAWVESVAKEAWNPEVFDKDLRAGKECKGEMRKLLTVGLKCSEWDPERRWDLGEVVERIEEVSDSDFDDYSSYATASEGDYRPSRAMTEEFSLM